MSFSLVGNEKLCTTVQNFIKEKRIPHAIIIEGDYGSGRHTLAKHIAKSIVCSLENAPCCECGNCHLADIDSHPDITTISLVDGKKYITVGQIRQLRDEAFIKPHQAQKRVFIIDPADSLKTESQNALLKILEEPPQTVMFILIAESKSSLLETIISRCVTITLNVPNYEKAYEYLKNTTEFNDDAIKEALLSEKNNIGKTLNILKGLAVSKTESAAKEYLDFLVEGNEFDMIKTVNAFAKNRNDAAKFIKELRYFAALKIKENPNGYLAKPLMAIYDSLPDYEKSLVTNINLNLLFSDLSRNSMKLIWRNK